MWFQQAIAANEVLDHSQGILSEGKRQYKQGEFRTALETFKGLQQLVPDVADEALATRIQEASAAGLVNTYLKLADEAMADGKRLYNEGDFQFAHNTFKLLQDIAQQLSIRQQEPLAEKIVRALAGGLGNTYLQLSYQAIKQAKSLDDQGKLGAALEAVTRLQQLTLEVRDLVQIEAVVSRILETLLPGLAVAYESLEQHNITTISQTTGAQSPTFGLTAIPEGNDLAILGDLQVCVDKYGRVIEYHIAALTLSRAIGVHGIQLANAYDGLSQFCQAIELEQVETADGTETVALRQALIPMISIIQQAGQMWAKESTPPFMARGILPMEQVRVTSLSEEFTSIFKKCRLKTSLVAVAIEWCNVSNLTNIGSITGVDAALKLCTANSFEKMSVIATTNQAAALIQALRVKHMGAKKLLKEFNVAISKDE